MKNNNKSFITYYKDKKDLDEKLNLIKKSEHIKLEIDGKIIGNKKSLFELFSKIISYPPYFGNNWDAFWDIISDNNYLNKKKLIIIINNKDDLFSDDLESESKDIFMSLLIDLIDLDGYFIFINK